MMRLSIAMVLWGLTLMASAQIVQPVKWAFSLKSIDAQHVEVVAMATMDKGWHVYGMHLPDGGPVPTRLVVEVSDGIELVGSVTDRPAAVEVFDKTFDMKVSYYKGTVWLTQKIKIAQSQSMAIQGEVEFMACNDEQCLAPEVLTFSLNYAPPVSAVAAPTPSATSPAVAVPLVVGSVTDSVAGDSLAKPEGAVVSMDEADSESTSDEGHSHWAIFWLAFAGGLAALLTPCVFPMIPMTVSFFTKHSKTRASGLRNASFYALSIIVIYVILGTVVTGIFGADSLNELSTAAWFNGLFGVLLIVFTISFFGAFELVLPSKWVNAADRGADKGGLIGSFFMATTLALVSFSCTGPIVGGLIVQAAREGGMAPVVGMLGFSSAIALPFAFFAAFPGYLNSLPKSGGWLNSVKVVLGFIELAFAFKFLSMADMILKLGWLPRELFLAVWIVIFGALGFYLLGKIRLPHDSPMERVPVSRFMLSMVVFSFTIYMIPGLWGAPVKLISGFPPPGRYAESPFGVGKEMPSRGGAVSSGHIPEGMHHGPQGILMFDDYEKALVHARKENKPLLLDFTGDGCVNCRKMEDNVWSNPVVKQMLENDFVVVSLVVDDREVLPESEQYVSQTGKRIRTKGHKWSDFQMTRFHRNSQPHYVILNLDEQPIGSDKAYDLDVDAYVLWLKNAVDVFHR
ncbi:MAG: thioredoxin family protein [Marinilabiliaceae bacterium]|nr:thioredoxin family protein [Marinilabiliaceae bacterium]